jgi:hypothetical protein
MPGGRKHSNLATAGKAKYIAAGEWLKFYKKSRNGNWAKVSEKDIVKGSGHFPLSGGMGQYLGGQIIILGDCE